MNISDKVKQFPRNFANIFIIGGKMCKFVVGVLPSHAKEYQGSLKRLGIKINEH